mmetsp:Transcript_44870/g.70292  ORF Transcript_44870/g.70292 Transcript_44870/m.70292 type:complete len:343 (-) Transcript_44870:61-1089(-)|eukprot:CAMPEP_0184293526 /NCGR_PEP_ID=MMETSP1049-20130417/4931_1 /TAXON_ID=77928 /ORGANISM="Proteomonas sulcata, Strain CCMP704" /LENGTH=342 /DNA_ID=CAMNT_0026601521 /DNA_START=78 /DNA_END=1106 /DNA_ORIENTATION=-
MVGEEARGLRMRELRELRAEGLGLKVGAWISALTLLTMLASGAFRDSGESSLSSLAPRPIELLQHQRSDTLTSMLSETEEEGSGFEDKISRQMKRLIKRAKKEQANADKEDMKGLALDSKAKRTCKISYHLQDTDDGLEKRARTQREAATSLEGRAALLITQANTETAAYEKLKKKGDSLRQNGQQLLEMGTQLIMKGSHLNATTHSNEKAHLKTQGEKKEDQGGRLVATAHAVLEKAKRHKQNADSFKDQADKTTAAAKATLQLGEKFEKEAVSHRLKTMTYRSKCTMMKAKAEAALRKAQDEAKNAQVLDNIVKPAEDGHLSKKKEKSLVKIAKKSAETH